MRMRAHVLCEHDPVIFVCFRLCECVRVSQSRSRKPLGGLSRETEEIEVGNSHQKKSKSGKVSTRATLRGDRGEQRRWRGVCVCVCGCVWWLRGVQMKERWVTCLA